jgi:hypothetical protein
MFDRYVSVVHMRMEPFALSLARRLCEITRYHRYHVGGRGFSGGARIPQGAIDPYLSLHTINIFAQDEVDIAGGVLII